MTATTCQLTLFLFREYPSKSYTAIVPLQIDVSDKEPAREVEESARRYIESQFALSEQLEVDSLRIYLCWQPLQGGSLAAKNEDALEAIEDGHLNSENFFPLFPIFTIEDVGLSRDIIIVFEIFWSFNFVLFERKSHSSYEAVQPEDGPHEVARVSTEDPIKTLYDAARSVAAESLVTEDSPIIYDISLYEVKEKYSARYTEVLETWKLEPTLLRRQMSILHTPEENVKAIKSSNLIFVFAVKRRLPIPYVLFHAQSGSYKLVDKGRVVVFRGDTVARVHECIGERIRHLASFMEATGYIIRVYEPVQAFQSVYDKQPDELGSLKLDEALLSLENCSLHHPDDALSGWREGQTLIIVFEFPVPSQWSSGPTSILEKLRHLHIAEDPPSTVAKLENYVESQKDAIKRISDDRPGEDTLIAPISLLFQPFGYFRDIDCGVKVPGEADIHEGELRKKVNALADAMTRFYRSNGERCSRFREHLEVVFDIPRGSIISSKTPDCETASDGHVDGAHGAMVLCLECTNEVSTASCEPAVRLVSNVAASFRSRADSRYQELFQRWRVPVLGVTLIGPNIQFFGIVWVGQMRIVPLTPSLPTVDPTGGEFRWNLFLALKAASIIFAKIRTDVQDILRVLQGPSMDWPPPMTTEMSQLPSITEIDAFPDPRSGKIKFVLEFRHDGVKDRYLYHARLVSPISSAKSIYVKFSQRYSPDLHRFCASRGLAPNILGFQQLSGGWFAVAMEEINTIHPWLIMSGIEAATEAKNRREDIEALVDDFHQEGLIHGDLRLANFVFTADESPQRMLLIDFDWGGKEGEVTFPDEELIEELEVSSRQLRGRKITKEHDRRCISKVLQVLDNLIRVGSGPTNP